MSDVNRDLGRHEAQIEALNKKVDELHRDLQTVHGDLQEIKQTLASARGGWKTLMAVGGLASAMTALAMKVWSVFFDRP